MIILRALVEVGVAWAWVQTPAGMATVATIVLASCVPAVLEARRRGRARQRVSVEMSDNTHYDRGVPMAHMRATVRVEIELSDGSTSVVERSITPSAFGDNAIFFGDVAEQAVHAVEVEVRDAIEAVHGKAPRPARVAL